ncbi:MAG: hypothetical protein HDT18_00575, partial [Oscillibacter sp.]|nr:hypothetical protein [Oscillibacter sp.]
MEFQLLKETITISPCRESYNKYRLKFQSEAESAVQRFHKLYQANTSLETVVQNVPEQMYQSMAPAIKLCVQILIDHGILTVDEDRFIDIYPESLEAAREAYQKIQDQYAEIVLDESEKDAYRKARREGRGRWVGGGRGLRGAVKGAATAGMLNAVSGIGHRAFNGVAKATSSMAAKSKMNKIFQSKDTESALRAGLYQSVYLLHIALIDCLNQSGADCDTVEGIVTPEDSEAAAAILKNIPQIRVPEQQYDAMVQAFHLDPYQETWYRYALQLYGDADGTLESVERYFGMSVIRGEKERQLNKFVQTLPLDTERQAQQAVRQINEEKKRLCYSGETEQTKMVHAAVERFDTEYRTVEGIIFSTRQEAEAARAEAVEINRVLQNINYTELDSIAGGEHKLKGFSSPLAEVRQKELHQRWTDLDTRLRTVDTLLPDGKQILCDTPEQAERLRPVVQDLKNRLDACGNGP